jgi:hypothetical protein
MGTTAQKVIHVFCNQCADAIGMSSECPVKDCSGTIPKCAICGEIESVEIPLEVAPHSTPQLFPIDFIHIV